MRRLSTYIYQQPEWPKFTWKTEELVLLLSEARNLQGRILGKMEVLGFDLRSEAMLETLTLDVLKTSEIEGELLDPEQVRSSIARKLGLDIAGSIASDKKIDGVVEMMLDATQNCNSELTKERLFKWHGSMFPEGKSGMYAIKVAGWREDTTGPMQVISGALGKEKVHFQAPGSETLEHEMNLFLQWFNEPGNIDEVLKAGISHLWFVTVHPFEDGNGRITRALTDMLLARSDKSQERFYSMSAQIRKERKQYYEILEKTQKGTMDITPWLSWFLQCLINSLLHTNEILNRILFKAEFWRKHAGISINARQSLLLNKLLDGFDGKLTSDKWSKIAKCSKDTAIRDINYLIQKNILQKDEAGGRSTAYLIRQ